MKTKSSTVKPASPEAQATRGPEVEVWEPPFERWLRLADDLLRDWPIPTPSATQLNSFHSSHR